MHIDNLGLAISLALGGLGLFLMSVKLLSNGLKSVSGEKLRSVLKKFTKTNVHSLIFGILFTTMIQSSDGSVALVISLVAAGFMPLRSALAFVLGANIGTATTSIIVSFASNFEFTQYFMILAFIGGMAFLLIKEKSKSNIAVIVASMGMLFIGLKVMGAGMSNVAHQGVFKDMVASVGKNGWLAALTSFVMTGLMQSSSATVTIAQGIYDTTEAISIVGAIGFVVGANIGTTVTAFLVTAGGNKDTKRIAVFWMITNTFMALIILPLVTYYGQFVQMIVTDHKSTFHSGYNTFEMAVAHVFFNIFLVVIFFPILKYMTMLVKWIIKEDKEVEFKYEANLPVNLIATSPQMAVEAANNAFYVIGEMNLDMLRSIQKFFRTKDSIYLSRTEKLNVAISEARKGLYDYLAKLNTQGLTEVETSRTIKLAMGSRSQERISELLVEFEEIIIKTYNKKTKWFDISDAAYDEIMTSLQFCKNVQKRVIEQSRRFTLKRDGEIKLVYKELLEFTDTAIENHQKRIKADVCLQPDIDYHRLMHLLDRITRHQYKMSKYFAHRKDKRTSMKETHTKRLMAILEEEEE